MPGHRRLSFLIGLAVAAQPAMLAARQSPPAAQHEAARDGLRDFDWEIGTWDTHVRVLRNPLSGAAPEWVEYRGTSVVRAILGGRANMVELAVEGPAGRIDGLSLRLYNPETRQWSLNYANMRTGALTAPVHGGFDASGRGTFHGQEMIGGRPVMVRFVIFDVTPDSARFEQAFSIDGGATWEANWIAADTRR